MKKLNQWFDNQRKKSEAIVTLEETLLGGSFLRYAWFRLRYFTFRTVVEVMLRLIELKVLLTLLPTAVAYVLIGIRILLVLGSGFWWGALEVFREKLRKLHRAGKSFKMPEVIGIWLSFSLLISFLGLVILLGVGLDKLRHGIRMETVYGLICFFRFLLEIPLTTFHSGVYAIRRIYRPLYWIVAIELVSSLGSLALFPWFGVWALPLAFLISSLLNFSIRFYYTKKVYYFYRYWPLSLNLSLKKWQRFGPLLKNDHFFIAGLAHAFMRYEVLLLILFFHHIKSGSESGNILTLIFILSPLLVASREWAQMFYFDFKRLEEGLYENFRKQFQRQVEDFSLLWGVGVWIMIMSLGTLILRNFSFESFLWLAPFFVINSLLAYEQVKAFSDKNYNLVIQSGFIFFIGTAFLWNFSSSPTAQFAYLGLTTLGALRQVRKNEEFLNQETPHVLSLLEWLEKLKNLSEPVKWGYLEINKEEKIWQLKVLAEEIRVCFNRGGEITLCFPNKILWFEGGAFTAEKLIKTGAGLIKQWTITPFYSRGIEILQSAKLKEVLELNDEIKIGRENLVLRFKDKFPRCFIYDFNEAGQLAHFNAKERRSILFDAVFFARNLCPSASRSAFEVTTLLDQGKIELIFVIPKAKFSQALRDQWSSELRKNNISYAMIS
ncbi:MAG: hypothetical protein K1X66_07790 [Verrucomicrobiae bacterium]|nr:hypothetical protein [Verrucomicrobiae bacterium]